MKEQTFAPSKRTPDHTAPQPRHAFELLVPELQKALAASGYETPTPIQEKCIPHLLDGRDILGTAQTGTGKTAAFVLPLLQKLSKSAARPWPGTPRALILAPTRELAAQIGESIATYGCFLRLHHAVVFGGVSQVPQEKALARGVDILVATPGRLLDLTEQGFIHLERVDYFVLDEVDRMLDMGFIPDIRKVLARIPERRQTLFFSATMSPEMESLARTMVHDPLRVSIEPDRPAVESIDQKVLFVGKSDKDALLVSLLNNPKVGKALIFTRMKHTANKVVRKLLATGISGTAIHGNKSQSARTSALSGFKGNRFQVLVATDVAARGLDVDNITHVINYDLPMEAETYIHRIGRTARAGASGDAISFCCAEERDCLTQIEKLLGKPVPAEMNHEYHSDEAFRSCQKVAASFGRSGSGRSRNGDERRRPRFAGRSAAAKN